MVKSVMRSKTLDELKEEVDIDLELRIDRTDIDSANSPKLYNKYHKEYRLVNQELISNQYAMKKLWRDKWLFYTGKADPSVYKKTPLLLKIMKTDVKMFIETDEDIIKLGYTIELYKNKLDFLEGTLKEIQKRSYHIKNIVETIKFNHGVS